jgi:hypothetical protein
MQLHGDEGMSQYQLQAFRHVALPGMRLLGVVAEVGALKQPPNDLTQGVDTRDRTILEPTDEETLQGGLPAPHHPLSERVGVGGRGHPAAVQ